MTEEKIIQPSELFELLGVKNLDEASRVFSTVCSFLIYMSPGTKLQTSSVTFEKLSDDLLHLDTNIDYSDIVESLNKKMILRFPV